MAFQENLDVFFDSLDSQDVLLGPEGEETTIRAYFERSHYQVEQQQTRISNLQTKLLCKSADLAGVAKNTRVVVGDLEYRIADIQPDGTGISEVFLHKA